MPDPFTSDQARDETAFKGQFVTTRWSVILEAAHLDSPRAIEGFAQLYRDYWAPLYAYVRRRGRSPHEAEELTQDFFVTLLQRERLKGLQQSGGRFRSFLLKAMQNFLASEWHRASAQKRGGGIAPVSLAEVEADCHFLADPSCAEPEAEFEHTWAITVINNALRNLERELELAGKTKLLDQLRPYLQGESDTRPYAKIAAELGMSESAVKVTIHRLRRRYGHLLRMELARTVASDDEVEAELQHLMEIISH
jgi:RNA polymerase sigma factor (sigma-70 family)